MLLKVKLLRPAARMPARAHPGDAGLDLFAAEAVALPPGGSALVPTGIAIELPAGTEAQIRPRSGLALRHQITVLNSPGTIDQGYRGEVQVILINHGPADYRVEAGEKIAQMVVAPVLAVELAEAEALSETRRGEGGFGSSGRR